MFVKFGKFNSTEELNRSAAGMKSEGDTQSIKMLGIENGIDVDDIQDYIDGYADKLASPLMAASGRINVEGNDLKLAGQLNDWRDLLISMCMDYPDLCDHIMSKDMAGMMANILKASSQSRVLVDDRIAKSAGIPTPLYIGSISKKETKQIIWDYYAGGQP